MTEELLVLMVEDSEQDAALIVRELRRAGLRVTARRVDGPEALARALASRRWDVVLADHGMPTLDAFRALELVRAADPDVSFVVVSGTIGEELAVSTMRAGAQDYVLKDRLGRLGPVVQREVAETRVRRERTRALESLRDAEARKAAIVEAALDAVLAMDHHGIVLDFNPAAERTFGYTRAEVIGRELAVLIVPERLRDHHRAGIARYLVTGEGLFLGRRTETTGQRKDGSEFPVELSVLRLPGTSPPVFTGFVRDISERKRAEEQLRRWAHVFQHAAWGIAVATPDDRFVEVNRAFAAMHGSEPEVWPGRPLADMLAEESRRELAGHVQEAHEKGHLVYESVHVRSDGSTFPVQADVTAFKDESGRVLFRAASFLDITDRKRAERALRASEELFRSFFDTAAVGMAILDPGADRFLRVNARMGELTGYGLDELRRLSPIDLLHPEDRGPARVQLERLIEGASSDYVRENRYIRKDGRVVWALVTGAVVRDQAGTPVRISSVVQDITALKRIEEDLREAVRARDDFLELASHELKTPLTPLQLHLELLGRRLASCGLEDERLGDELALASRQVSRLVSHVETLLDVSRVAAGRVELDLEPVDLAQLVRAVVDRHRPSARRAGSELVVSADRPILGRWDRARLEQVISSLVTNAIKFGQGRPIEIEARIDGTAAILSVQDHGIGIEAGALGRIFNRFERAVSLRQFGGFGLGLFLARQFVEAHGGRIAVESRPGAGSRFSVVLPLEAPVGDVPQEPVHG